jgi:acyl dehydratase
MLGLEFSFQFRKPVRAGDTLEMTWEVVAVEAKDSLNGDLVSLRGSMTNQAGAEVLGATGKVLVTAAL